MRAIQKLGFRSYGGLLCAEWEATSAHVQGGDPLKLCLHTNPSRQLAVVRRASTDVWSGYLKCSANDKRGATPGLAVAHNSREGRPNFLLERRPPSSGCN